MKRKGRIDLAIFMVVFVSGVIIQRPLLATTKTNVDPSSKTEVLEAYGKLPLAFEVNRGQTNSQVKFLSRGNGYTLYLTPTEAVLTLQTQGERSSPFRSNKTPN